MEERGLEEEEVWVWEESKKDLENLMWFKNRDLHQKARVKWALSGDENSAFFHRCIKGRKASNAIPGLHVNGGWVSKPSLVKREVPTEKVDELIAPFTKEEIKEAAFDCGADKSLFEEDFVRIFNGFFELGTISKECSTSFITLIAKTKVPVGLKDYRPINLIGVISKIISKVIAARIKKVIGKVISNSQSAFIKERFILDGPLVLNEIIGWVKKNRKQVFLLKIDFEKAYDNVNWEFLLSIMSQMGFPSRWCMWVRGILQSARSAVLVNGSPTFEFQCHKGLRQGDPLSPFLFLVVMEALACMISKACRIGEFEGVRIYNGGPIVSHMLYADDALILGCWSKDNVETINRLLRVFHCCSGLKINLHKSTLFGMGVVDTEVGYMSSLLGCKVGALPFDYLGIKVGANMNRISNWDTVMDTIRSRLTSWKAKLLSIGGRLTLIKSVLVSLPVYYMSLYRAPLTVIENIEKIIRHFLWSGGKDSRGVHWVSWEVVTRLKKDGGLGITKVADVNTTLLAKWAWRFKTETDGFWKSIIDGVHGGRRTFLPINNDYSGCWKTIVKFLDGLEINGQSFKSLLRGEIGNGESIRFWKDLWWGSSVLMVRWPRLYEKESDKNARVGDRLNCSGGVVYVAEDWSIEATSVEAISELQDLNGSLSRMQFKGGNDGWSWSFDSSEKFSVASVKTWLRSACNLQQTKRFKWEKWLPVKVNMFIWQMELDRIPTRPALVKRRINIPDTSCPFCAAEDETTLHLMVNCGFVFGVWSKVWSWCKIYGRHANSIVDLLQQDYASSRSKVERRILRGVMLITCWEIWNERNKKVFQEETPRVLNIVARVKALSFIWFKHRARFKNIEWIDWTKYPLYIL
ncbi:uncharacterized protein LOC110920261 [Helianthus annuus]|uniref:uncharacterized protein LOC110920261 n=1 Tax=Helianthus annuus TaxID=4232 RepID=UPI000B8EF384|nr:uncharacterized protein LOC110920261 [Helianthus annuus]